MVTKHRQSSPPPLQPVKLVKLNKAFELAGKWVKEMGGCVEDDVVEVGIEARPPRLGLGAAVPRTSTFKPLNDSVERKLQLKLKYAKKKDADKEESSSFTKKESNDDDDDGESESRSAAFSKKRVAPMTTLQQARKKTK